MAAIDKIYLNTQEQYRQFKKWCYEQPPLCDKYGKEVRISDYLWNRDDRDEPGPVMSAPCYIDAYIIRNCPLDFVQEELMINYGHYSQKRLREYYEDIKNWKGDGECPYWAKLEDFVFNDDGTITLTSLNGESYYEKIKEGKLYTSPKTDIEYTPGKHFVMVDCPRDHGYANFNRPLMGGWFIDVTTPDGIDTFLWYHPSKKRGRIGTWDFPDEFVESGWSSSSANCKTVKSLARRIKKWGLPVNSVVTLTGRYVSERYVFKITK